MSLTNIMLNDRKTEQQYLLSDSIYTKFKNRLNSETQDPSLLGGKLAQCGSQIRADMRIMGQRQSSFNTADTASSSVHFHISSPCPAPYPKMHGGNARQPRWRLCTEWICIPAEDPQVQETLNFYNGLQANLSDLCTGRTNIYYTTQYNKQQLNLPSAPEGNTLYHPGLSIHSGKDNPEQKLSVPLFASLPERERLMQNGFPIKQQQQQQQQKQTKLICDGRNQDRADRQGGATRQTSGTKVTCYFLIWVGLGLHS